MNPAPFVHSALAMTRRLKRRDRCPARLDLAQVVAGIVVHRDRLIIRLKSDNADQDSDSPEDRLLSIPWRKPPSKKSRQMLLPHNASRSDVRPRAV